MKLQFSMRLIWLLIKILTVNDLCFFCQGDFGAAGTILFCEDHRLNTSYSGFPYVIWTEEMTVPEIRVQPPVSL